MIYYKYLYTFIAFSPITIFSFSYGVTAGFITDTNSNDKTNAHIPILRDKIVTDCQSHGINLQDSDLESYLSCFTNPHIPLTYSIDEDINQVVSDMRPIVDEILEDWCFDWTEKTKCVRANINVVEPCISSERSILMDFNLAFGDALCSKDGRELFNVYIQFIAEGGIQCLTERNDILEGMLSCISPLNIAHFSRNLYRVTECMVDQLKQCPTDGPMELFGIIVDYSSKFYKSTATGDRHLLKSDENDKTKGKQSDIDTDDYVQIIPKHEGTIYIYVYIGVAVGICVWLILAISFHMLCGEKGKEVMLKNKGWERV